MASETHSPGATLNKSTGAVTFTNNVVINSGSSFIANNSSNNDLFYIFNNGASGLNQLYISDLTGTPMPMFLDGTISVTGKIVKYNNITTVGNGVPSIYGSNRATGQTAAVSSVATYTVGSSDGSFIVSGNVLVTSSTTHNFSLQVTYTDEGNTSRTVTMNVQQLGGTLVTAITNLTGIGPYEGVPLHIRCKSSTAITILTSGTFTSVTYNVEGVIQQIA